MSCLGHANNILWILTCHGLTECYIHTRPTITGTEDFLHTTNGHSQAMSIVVNLTYVHQPTHTHTYTHRYIYLHTHIHLTILFMYILCMHMVQYMHI